MLHFAIRARRPALALCTVTLVALTAAPSLTAQKPDPAPAPNYNLAAQWTSQKVGKLVFDTSVTPRWLEKSDRFWYAFRTREGRRFYLVDPLKKSKAPLFDHAKMAANLTTMTRIPYDAQHLPFTSVRFVKNDTAFEFDVQVPADATVTRPVRPITTEQASRGQQGDQPAVEELQEQQQQQQQQQRAGAAGRTAEAAQSDAALRVPTSPRPASRSSTTIKRILARRAGYRCRLTARPSCSRERTTSS